MESWLDPEDAVVADATADARIPEGDPSKVAHRKDETDARVRSSMLLAALAASLGFSSF